MKRQTITRTGFTLIELVVVVTIIALLAAITTSAVFRYRESSKETNTNVHIRKLHMGLEQQWKAAVEKIKNEPIPEQVYDFTANTNGLRNNARAKALHMKLRLRQEFPQNFVEARTAVQIPPVNPALPPYVYGPKKYFTDAIRDAAPPANEQRAAEQSAALLLLILSEGRGGVAFDAEGAVPIQVFEFDRVPTPPWPAPQPGAKHQLRVALDPWNRPIAFRRAAPDGFEFLAELNQPPFISPAQAATFNSNPDGEPAADPQDPEGQLGRGKGWNPTYRGLALTFFNTAPLANPYDGTNRGPFVYSAGRDQVYLNENDLYSFRLQATGKGN